MCSCNYHGNLTNIKRNKAYLPAFIRFGINGKSVIATFNSNSPISIVFEDSKKHANFYSATVYALKLLGESMKKITYPEYYWTLNTPDGEVAVYYQKEYINTGDSISMDNVTCFLSKECKKEMKIVGDVKYNCGSGRSKHKQRMLSVSEMTVSDDKKRKKTRRSKAGKRRIVKQYIEEDDEPEEDITWRPDHSKEWDLSIFQKFIIQYPHKAPILKHIESSYKEHPVYCNERFDCVFLHPDGEEIKLSVNGSILYSVADYRQIIEDFRKTLLKAS